MPLGSDRIGIPSWSDAQARLKRAVDFVTENDLELLRDDCHECSVAHQIACYLRPEFPEWHVDCEFNLEGENRDPKRNRRGTVVRPDIIVHRRGPEGPNLLVLEVKKRPDSVGEAAWRDWREEIEKTRAKLVEYRETQGYVYPVLLIYAVGPRPAFDAPELVTLLRESLVPDRIDEA